MENIILVNYIRRVALNDDNKSIACASYLWATLVAILYTYRTCYLTVCMIVYLQFSYSKCTIRRVRSTLR